MAQSSRKEEAPQDPVIAQSTALADLPDPALALVCQQSSTEDLKALRRTCRALRWCPVVLAPLKGIKWHGDLLGDEAAAQQQLPSSLASWPAEQPMPRLKLTRLSNTVLAGFCKATMSPHAKTVLA